MNKLNEIAKPDSVQAKWQGDEDYQAILEQLKVSLEQGLNSTQVSENQNKYGKNALQEKSPISPWKIFIDQFKSIMIILLVVTAIVSFVMEQWVEGIAVIAVITINTGIGFFTEFKAKTSMEALRNLSQQTTKVLRNGKVNEIPAEEITIGDILLFEAGDMVTADVRLITSSKLNINESALTGESVPVEKTPDTLTKEVPIIERANMLFKGTAVTNGSAKTVVLAIGMETELGKISTLVETAEEGRTPLEERLDKMSTKLIWVTLFIAVFIIVLGIITGKELIMMIKTGIALAVAAIPEGLPIVATMALAKGMWSMAKKKALINKLSSVETLGAVTVICTDKTGTLTENKMTVQVYELDEGRIQINPDQKLDNNSVTLNKALEVGVLCNTASSEKDGKTDKSLGDPMELALLQVAERKDLSKTKLYELYPLIKEDAFDNTLKMMATYHKQNEQVLIAVKGAPEAVFEVITKRFTNNNQIDFSVEDKESWKAKSQDLANQGLRVLALAYKEVNSESEKPYENLIFIGLVGLLDPPRSDVKEAIMQCKTAGIRIIMATGDQKGTAINIAKAVSIIDTEENKVLAGEHLEKTEELDSKNGFVFYRINPKQKLELVEFLQERNEIVAMTGDGVNDAPALKKSDIGIAMGQRGTQVAKDIADMVLQDDRFNTIVAAIGQGRVIYSNIRRFVIYLLSCNISEIFIVLLATLVNFPLPILPLQILYLNLITDVFPALALGVGEGDESYLKQAPRDPKEAILLRSHWLQIAAYGMLITIAVLTSFYIALNHLNLGIAKSITIAFLTLGFSQVFHVFNMRNSQTTGLLINDISKNPYIWGAILLCTFLLVAPVYTPGLNKLLALQLLNVEEWALILSLSFLPLVLGLLFCFISREAAEPQKISKVRN